MLSGRGFHLRQGSAVSRRVTSIATFQGLFLATDREYTEHLAAIPS